MDTTKRLACLAVFLWTAFGARLAWKEWKPLRPWLVTVIGVSLPTFIIYEPHDSFRYHMPYLPFLFLFFMTPFRYFATRRGLSWARVPAAACALLAAGQVLHSSRANLDAHFIEWPREFDALHDSVKAAPGKPGVLLSPMAYYSYLRTDLPTLFIQDRYGTAYLKEHTQGREVWAICGPRNDYFCERCEAEGLVFAKPPLRQIGPWKLYEVAGWPVSPPSPEEGKQGAGPPAAAGNRAPLDLPADSVAGK